MEDQQEVELEIIDAFVDGERVNADALKSALADPAGRDYLIDVWMLREAAQGEPVREHKVAVPQVVRPARGASWWLVAAAFAAALVGGFAGGQIFARRAPVATIGAPEIAATPSATPKGGPFPVPVPTRVIQLEFRSTSASSGGN